MGEGSAEKTAALETALARNIELKIALQKALNAADADRSALRQEVRVLDARLARLHDELSSAHNRQAELHDELDSAYRGKLEAQGSAPLLETTDQPPLETAAPPAVEPQKPPSDAKPPRAAKEVKPPVPLQAAPMPKAIEVRELRKLFQTPSHQMETLKERALHPFRSRAHGELLALDGISFDVAEGEFLGIAGPNGSGKSTLLKVLASVYAADWGTIRVAGRVAPFIELGVGLNPELAAYDNVVVSGVMMGLQPEEARALYPEIIEFAGLEAFTKVKLKNYSSGMRVRLAFSVMAQVDADILLIDEVLAVGDAEFREKCLARLRVLRDAGKTIVFVSHAMDTMRAQCDRAILLLDGRITVEGTPAEVADAYNDAQSLNPTEEPPLKVAKA